MQVVDLVLLAQGADGAPVGIRNRKPLAVTGADIDVDGAEVVVFLVAGGSAAGNLKERQFTVHKLSLELFAKSLSAVLNECAK